ncbi:bacterioferritin [Thiopseudomonas acetoxidans]|uniref:Bacterioferritin n=1 Tax=Thiopseudomonas acetoxidans TaxID=3041622 RepID=A0ABT7ST36_9GAMM|nr:bacterioferritin [Thiopseudomonas sp. CY1220]MDM7858689.1 bacterioferritin [Thiopseudomonas sp. CY1220]
MQGDRQVITHLNQVLAQQLVAINQYFLHARMYKDWGFERLDKLAYKASIVVMCNADELIKRVLFLQGLPNMQELGRLRIGEHVQEMLECDMQLVKQGHQTLLAAIAQCEQAKDYVSRELLQDILDKEEEHLDVLETELSLMQQLGAKNYLQQQMNDQ